MEEKSIRPADVLSDSYLLEDLSDFFAVFADPTRIRILYLLAGEEKCVCDIAEEIGMTQSAVSHQLRLLKHADLVRSNRNGKSMIYSLSDDHVKTILSMGMEHINE